MFNPFSTIREANKDADEKRKVEADARNDADSMIFTTEKAIKDLGDKVKDDDKKAAEELIADLKKALEGNNVDEIKEKTEALKEKAMALSSSVYEEMAKANAANQNNESNEGGAEEAEFVNKD